MNLPENVDGAGLKVYSIDGEPGERQLPDADVVGAKAANLMRMAGLGLPVPPGFVLGTDHCARYFDAGGRLPDGFKKTLAGAVERLESVSNQRFGGSSRPLLVSVRSGAAQSMPGMLDTVLNVGLNDVTVSGLIRSTGNPRLAWDSYRRFIQTYAEVVHGCHKESFEALVREAIAGARIEHESELDTPCLRQLTHEFQALFSAITGSVFPQDPLRQLFAAVEAVFRSWMNEKAVEYRRLKHFDNLIGTAAAVQTMVFGNAGATSGAGVGFSRNPATGEKRLYLDFAFNAQGEDVVAGRHATSGGEELRLVLPEVYGEIESLARTLENEFRDLQDFEFTVQDGKLSVLQARAGKRTPLAALNIAVDMVDEGLIEPDLALRRLDGFDLQNIAATRFANADGDVLAVAAPASVGVASGRIAFDSRRAKAWAAEGTAVVLVRRDASTDDLEGIGVADGVLTMAGAKTSHAAVVARELGKVCLVGCRQLLLGQDTATCTIGGRTFAEGEYLSLDGDNGRVFAGRRAVVSEAPADKLSRVARWRDGDGAAAGA